MTAAEADRAAVVGSAGAAGGRRRAPRCALIVFVDDATSRLLALRFLAAETTEAYMETLRGHLAEHGRPVALYLKQTSHTQRARPV